MTQAIDSIEDIYDENEPESSGGEMKPATELSFIRTEQHDLAFLYKGLKANSQKAIRRLVLGMESENERLAIDCAKTLLSFQMEVSKEINADIMQRMIQEVKNKGANRVMKDIMDYDYEDESLTPEEVEQVEKKKAKRVRSNAPIINFSKVGKVEAL
jgi:hypothetical protein